MLDGKEEICTTWAKIIHKFEFKIKKTSFDPMTFEGEKFKIILHVQLYIHIERNRASVMLLNHIQCPKYIKKITF